MKLLSMKITNFKGIRSLMLDFPDGGDYNIYGTNGAGKTTIVDALTWLLFDKDNMDTKDFSVKTIVDGEPLHHAEHSVECAFLMENGLRVTLKKIFKEKWQRPRGKLEYEFAGHTTEYYIDNLGKSATEYKRYISSIVDEKLFKTLTNPLYFNENLKDAERRKILMDIIGGVDQDVVIALNPELEELTKLLNGRPVEDFKQITKQSISKTKKEIDGIEPAIKEHQAMMIPGADAANKGMYEEAVRREDEEIASLIRQIEDGKKNIVPKELTEKREQVKDRLRAIREAEKELYFKQEREIADELNKARIVASGYDSQVMKLRFSIDSMEREIKACEGKRESLLKQFETVKGTTFEEPEIDTTCPTCGQELPAERIEEIRQELEQKRKKFMLDRANAMKMINEKGRANKSIKAETERKIEEARKSYDALSAELEQAKANVNSIEERLKIFRNDIRETSPAILKAEAELAEVEAAINKPQENDWEEFIRIRQAKRQEAEARRQEAQAKLNEITGNMAHQARIRELHEKETQLSANYTMLKKQEFLCDEYNRKVTDYIDSKIADKFKLARFVMFKDNITNDGAKECCEVQVNGVPYHDINKTMKLNIGLDIIQTLCSYYSLTMPVFIDNAESYVSLLPTSLQIIRLVVSADDKTLRVEKN